MKPDSPIGDLKSRMRWTDTVVEAAAVISPRPARTLLSALGTIIGVAAFVATTGLAATASAQVSSAFDALKATEVRIQDTQPDGSNPFPEDVDQRLTRLNGINHAGLSYGVNDTGNLNPRNTASRPLNNSLGSIPIMAATPGALLAAQTHLSDGVLFNQFHQVRAERVVVLGRVAAEKLGVTRVDNQPAVFIGDIGYTVVGIIDESERSAEFLVSIIMPTSTEQKLINSRPTKIEVLIDVQPGAASLVGRQAPIALYPQQPERLLAIVPPDPSTLRNNVEADVTSLYYALAGLSLLVGTIAIANATLLNTIERRPEIGLRRALGAKRSHITRQIILEAAVTGTVAGVTGSALATIAVSAISASRGWTTTLDPTIVFIAPLVGLVTGAIAGTIPALRASRVAPAVTLRT